MTSLNNKLQNIGVLFGDVLGKTYHYHKSDRAKPPYAVWMEDGEDDSLYTDEGKGEQAIAGTLDFFTKTEFDSCVDGFQNVLDANMARWSLNSVQYEDETGLIHYSWEWVIL